MINVEATLIAYLNGILPDGVSAFADVPAQRPDTFVLVSASGGSSTLFTSTPMVTIQCWAPTKYLASELAYLVHSSLPDAADVRNNGITRVERGAPYDFSDGTQSRYQIVADVHTI